MAASLVDGASTGLMQPDNSATRPRRVPSAGIDFADAVDRRCRPAARRQAQHRRHPVQAEQIEHRRQRLRDQPGASASRNSAGSTSTRASSAAHDAVGQRALVRLLDVLAGVIDQMHVVHARRAGGHAGEARQATVDVLDHLARCWPVVFEHLLDQVDAPARANRVRRQAAHKSGRSRCRNRNARRRAEFSPRLRPADRPVA